MRRLSYLLVLMTALLSCTREPLSPAETGGPYISLELRCNDPVEVVSKAGADGTQDGVDRYNENLISTVDFFFWPGNATASDAVYHTRLTSGNRRSDVFRLEMTSDVVNNRIFPAYPSDIREAYVLAVVNYPGTMVADEEDLSGTSLEEINAIVKHCTDQAVSAKSFDILQMAAPQEEPTVAEKKQAQQDELLEKAVEIVVREKATVSFLQRRLVIGYNRAATLMETLQQAGIVSPDLPGTPGKREVLVTSVEEALARLGFL